MGHFTEPLLFYFSEGENTIGFESIREPMEIGNISVFNKHEIPTYTEMLEIYQAEGLKSNGSDYSR